MALVKSVEIDIGVKGDTASKAKLDAINARAEELKKAFPEYTLKIDSAAASERLAVFRGQVKATADEASKPIDTVILTADAKKKLLEVQAKAEELKARFPELHLAIDDSAAKRKLAIFAAEAKATADAVDAEMATAGGGGGRGTLSRLFGGGGGGAGGAGGSAASSGGGLLTSPAGLGAIGGAGALAAALTPGVVGLGLGGAAGLGGIGLTALFATQTAAAIKLDQAQVKAAKSSAQLAKARTQLAADMKASAPFIAIQADLKDLLAPLEKAVTPFAKFLDPILKNLGAGLSKLGPVFSQVFDASIPFVKVFADLMLQMGKSLLPAVASALNQMVASGALPIMTQGLVILIKGLAGFITALGPGMRSSALIFRDLMVIAAHVLRGLGLAATWTANTLEVFFHRFRDNITKMADQFTNFRHRTAVIFDGVRHDIAHIWDQIWDNTLGRLQRGIADDQRLITNFRHSVAGTFDNLRHDIAATWDLIWSNTVGRTQRGISDMVGLFRGLPGRAVAALFGLGHSLASFASSSISQMWTGFKNTFAAVIHWFQGLPKMILNALGVHSPPGWAIGAGKWIMKGLHIGLGHGLGQLTSFTTSIGAQVAGALSGALGGGMGDSGARTHSAAVAQAYARSLLSQYGWSASQMSSLIPLWNQESGWNAYAVNPSSGAYGIPQSLGHGHPYNLGDYKNQIIWGLNYIRGRYGSPAAAESHEQRFNWYDKGGWLMPGLTLAMNKTGRPERVLPPGQSGTGQHVVMTVRAPHGATAFERALVEIVQKFVIVNGGGDVQAALGQKA